MWNVLNCTETRAKGGGDIDIVQQVPGRVGARRRIAPRRIVIRTVAVIAVVVIGAAVIRRAARAAARWA